MRERSHRRFGARMLPGGDLYRREEAWFALTDGRPEDYVTEWLKTAGVPVIRIDGTLPAEDNVEYLIRELPIS